MRKVFILLILSIVISCIFFIPWEKSTIRLELDTTISLFHKFKETPKEEVLSWRKGFSNTSYAIYQLSAYLDNRTGIPEVRVIAATNSEEEIFCFLFLNTLQYIVKASVIPNTYFQPKYKIIYLSCKPQISLLPQRVSLVVSSEMGTFPLNDSHKYTIPILPLTIRPSNKNELQLGVCYQPLYSNGPSHQLMDMHIQVMRALQVDKFIIYYDRDYLSAKHKEIIDYYVSQDIIVGISWKLLALPTTEPDATATLSHYAQIADCYYRFIKDFDYIFNLDFDEFPITQNNHTLKEYFSSLREKDVADLSHVIIPNSYIETQPFENKSIPEMVEIFTSPNTTVVRDCLFQDTSVSDPAKIVWGYVNSPSQVMPGLKPFHLDKSIVGLYHMKPSEKLEGFIKKCQIKDEGGHKTLVNLLKSIKFRN